MTDYFIHPGPRGSDSSSGTSHARPRQTLRGLTLKPRDRVFLAAGQTFPTQVITSNECQYLPYETGTDKGTRPTIKVSGASSKGLWVKGKDNTFLDVAVEDAETCVFVEPLATGNQFIRLRVDNFGHGALIHGSHTAFSFPVIRKGRMIRNVSTSDYVGASAFTLWKHESYECVGVKIYGAHIEDAWAGAIATKDGDGACVEIFGGVKDAEIVGLTSLNSKILVEIGGTPSRNEQVTNILFLQCFTSGSGGKVMFVNDPKGAFGVDWRNVRMHECTFKADEYDESPFFFAGDHGDMKDRLSITNSIIVATSQVYNGGAGTLPNTIDRDNNLYYRTDGSTNLGVKMTATEHFGDPRFVDMKAMDYRLPADTPYKDIGAQGRAYSDSEKESLAGPVRRTQTELPRHRDVLRWQEMIELPMDVRVAGMTVYVEMLEQAYVLGKDRRTWRKR